MKATDKLDWTADMGPLYEKWFPITIPMYSFNSPSCTVWNAIANVLHERGWSEAEIKRWLQSKEARWAMDGVLENALDGAAREYARRHIKEKVHE